MEHFAFTRGVQQLCIGNKRQEVVFTHIHNA
jgi:hypothetical protein